MHLGRGLYKFSDGKLPILPKMCPQDALACPHSIENDPTALLSPWFSGRGA